MKHTIIICFVLLILSRVTFSQSGYGSNLSATVAIPTGVSSEYYNTGYGAIGGFYYDMESGWRIGLTLGFIRFGINSTEVNNYFQTLGQEGALDIDGSVSTIPILLSGKYIIPAGAATKFYGIVEGGLYTYWTKAKGNIIYTGTNSGTVPVDKSEFSSEIGFALGFGVLFPISKEISIDANIRYHFVKNSGTIKVKYDNNYENGEESVGSSHFMNIGVGANWNFDL